MESVKHAKYTDCCRQSNVSLTAFVLSSFGMLGEEAERFFRCVCMARRRRALDDDDPQDVRRYMQQLQITLKREVARMLLQGPLDSMFNGSAHPLLVTHFATKAAGMISFEKAMQKLVLSATV